MECKFFQTIYQLASINLRLFVFTKAENEKTANFLLRISDFSEPALDGELNVHTVDIDRKTTTEEVVEKVLDVTNKYKYDL